MKRMMKRIFQSLLVVGLILGLTAQSVQAQARATTTTGTVTIRQIVSGTLTFADGTSIRIPAGTSVPGTCTVGMLFFKTAATIGLYQCKTTNTWTAVSDGVGTFPFKNANSDTVASLDANDNLLLGGGTVVQVYGQFATVTTDLADPNANIQFTARPVGTQANAETITYVDPGMANQSLSLGITYPTLGTITINVNLATDGASAITTTAQDIIDAFDAADAGGQKATHTMAVASGGDASAVVEAGSWVLSGGVNGVALKQTGLDVSSGGFGSYAGRKTVALLDTTDEDAWSLWFGKDNGIGFQSNGANLGLYVGNGAGGASNTLTFNATGILGPSGSLGNRSERWGDVATTAGNVYDLLTLGAGVNGQSQGVARLVSSTQNDTHNAGIAVWDANDATLRDFLVWTNGDAPAVALTTPTTGSLTVSSTTNTSGAYVTALTSPAVANIGANSCGTTAATIAGTDNAWAITVGATAGTACRVTFDTTAPTVWACSVSNQTTANLTRQTAATTTTVDVTGTMVAGDVLIGVCFAR